MSILFDAFESFSHQCKLMIYHWTLSDSKSHQVSQTLHSYLANPNNAAFSMVLTRPLISKFSSLLSDNFQVTIVIVVTFMFHIFSVFEQLLIIYPSFYFIFSFFFSLCGLPDGKVHYSGSFLFFFWPRLDDQFVYQNPREFWVSTFLPRIVSNI